MLPTGIRSILSTLVFILLLNGITTGQESYIDSTRIKNPKLAWKLSAVPGLGQVYNEKYVKAAILGGSQYYAVSQFIKYRDEERIGRRNTYAWWILGLWVYGMLDAYVDAQLSSFPVKTESDSDPEATERSQPLKED